MEFFLDRRVSGLDMDDPVERARAVEALIEVVGLIDKPDAPRGVHPARGPAGGDLGPDAAGGGGAAAQPDRSTGCHGRLRARPRSTPPTAEEQLISIGLNHAGCRERIAAALAPEEIRDPILQRIFIEFVQSGALPGPRRRGPRR